MQEGALNVDVAVVGAGPTGLGAAVRLTEKGCSSWCLLDAADVAGGLSRSFKDDYNFTWDIGGHVIFSHYQYYDDVMDLSIDKDGWNVHQRESHIYVAGTWVPYPFQNNIHRLPAELRDECLDGLVHAASAKPLSSRALNFEEWITGQFGDGISSMFMRPYNTKLWTVPPSAMSCEWVGERVAQIDLAKIKRNIETNADDVGWGPNATFRFPKEGGTGGIYRSLSHKLPQGRLHFGPENKVVAIDPLSKVLTLRSGKHVHYKHLLSSIPLDDLLRALADGVETHGNSPAHPAKLDAATCRLLADRLDYSSTHVVGLGVRGAAPPFLKTACWLYFPESHICFYRATVFSNYAESNAPEGCWSLMLEVSEKQDSDTPAIDTALIERCVQGCVDAGLLARDAEIVSRWHHFERKGYPIPTSRRHEVLARCLTELRETYSIYSRGRFGAWKYEVANQDHSLMQGVEAVDHILHIKGDETLTGRETCLEPTLHHPNLVNTSRGAMHCGLLHPES